MLNGYRALLRVGRGRRTYAYVLLNALLHSGRYPWLGLYFMQRHGLSEISIGMALLGYGITRFLLWTACRVGLRSGAVAGACRLSVS